MMFDNFVFGSRTCARWTRRSGTWWLMERAWGCMWSDVQWLSRRRSGHRAAAVAPHLSVELVRGVRRHRTSDTAMLATRCAMRLLDWCVMREFEGEREEEEEEEERNKRMESERGGRKKQFVIY